jgi:predicted nucleotidyltransferase
MNLRRPHATVTGGALEGDVLAVLAGTTKPLTGRQVGRMAGHGSDRGIRIALNRLAEQGLVHAQDAPPAVLYTLNRDHIAAPIVFALASLRSDLLTRLRSSLEAWEIPPVHASLFGSAARGEADVDSDIDVFVLRPASVDVEQSTWRAQLDALARDIERWTGNAASVSELSEADLVPLAAGRPPIVEEISRDGVTLAGVPADRLFGGGR